jgi:hypothetical protein
LILSLRALNEAIPNDQKQKCSSQEALWSRCHFSLGEKGVRLPYPPLHQACNVPKITHIPLKSCFSQMFVYKGFYLNFIKEAAPLKNLEPKLSSLPKLVLDDHLQAFYFLKKFVW